LAGAEVIASHTIGGRGGPDPIKVPTLRNWICAGDPRQEYVSLEERDLVLHGQVFGHHDMLDGMKITTTPIIWADGREVVTASGTHYRLEDPDPRYVAWLVEQGTPLDEEAPLGTIPTPPVVSA
jgi:hypothetical protein